MPSWACQFAAVTGLEARPCCWPALQLLAVRGLIDKLRRTVPDGSGFSCSIWTHIARITRSRPVRGTGRSALRPGRAWLHRPAGRGCRRAGAPGPAAAGALAARG